MRVCIVPEYPMSLMTGGLQVQADETYGALANLGGSVQAELFNWSERRPLADLYHFIGFPEHMQRVTELLRQAKRPYIVTLLFGSDRDPIKLWIARARRVIRSRLFPGPGLHQSILGASAIITVTEEDAHAARFIFRLSPGDVHVIPHGISESFFAASPAVWEKEFGTRPFILCVGAVQPRKNQLPLLQAANELQLPVVLLGPILPGEAEYAGQVTSAAAINQKFGGRWLTHLRNEDPLLVSAYAACRAFVLLSSAETQPLSVMQAMAAQKPVLLLDAPYVRDSLFSKLPSSPSLNRRDVIAALNQAWTAGERASLSRDYAWGEVARRLQIIYKDTLER